MSTPIFDRLFAESDDTTRALVWDAVRPVSTDISEFIEHMRAFGRAFAAVATTELTPHTTSAEARRTGLLGGIGDNA